MKTNLSVLKLGKIAWQVILHLFDTLFVYNSICPINHYLDVSVGKTELSSQFGICDA